MAKTIIFFTIKQYDIIISIIELSTFFDSLKIKTEKLYLGHQKLLVNKNNCSDQGSNLKRTKLLVNKCLLTIN